MRHEFAGLRHGRKRGLFSSPLPIELFGSSVGHRHSVRGAGHLQPAAESYGERNNERHHRSFRPRDISLRQRQCDGFQRVPIALTEAWTPIRGADPRHLRAAARGPRPMRKLGAILIVLGSVILGAALGVVLGGILGVVADLWH